MLTESQYKELLRYRGNGIQYGGNLNAPLRFLLRKKYVVFYHPAGNDGAIINVTICVITEAGKDALCEFEDYTEHKREEEEKRKDEKTANEKQIALDRKKQFKREIIAAIIGSAVGGIIVLAIQNWPSIVSFLANLLHQISPP